MNFVQVTFWTTVMAKNDVRVGFALNGTDFEFCKNLNVYIDEGYPVCAQVRQRSVPTSSSAWTLTRTPWRRRWLRLRLWTFVRRWISSSRTCCASLCRPTAGLSSSNCPSVHFFFVCGYGPCTLDAMMVDFPCPPFLSTVNALCLALSCVVRYFVLAWVRSIQIVQLYTDTSCNSSVSSEIKRLPRAEILQPGVSLGLISTHTVLQLQIDLLDL